MIASRRKHASNATRHEEPYAHGPYLVRPDRAIEEALRRHIEETGTPETFPGMILRPLPPGATPEVVLKSYKIGVAKRADGKMAPCAQCSPRFPKFIEGGAIWCPQDGWVRQVGCDCVEEAIGTPEYAQMQARRDALERGRDADDFLLNRWAAVSRVIAYVRTLSTIAGTISEIMGKLDRELRGWRTEVWKATKNSDGRLVVMREHKVQRDSDGSRIGPRGFTSAGSGVEMVSEAVGMLLGRRFVDRKYHPLAAIQAIDARLPAIGWRDADSAFAAVAAMTTDERIELVAIIRKADSDARLAASKLEDAMRFLSRDGLRSLARWGAHKAAPLPFTIQFGVASATIKHDEHTCCVPYLDDLVVPNLEPLEPNEVR